MNHCLLKQVEDEFRLQFDRKPLLIFSPGRINLIGEHTDYNNGLVFPAAIDKGIYLGIAPSKNENCTVNALDVNEVLTFSLDEITAIDKSTWKNYVLGVVNEVQKISNIPQAFDIIFKGDIPIGSGLSSSAALENAVVLGLNELFDLKLSKEQMIHISQRAEHNFVGVKCGIMDQFASMFGEQNSALLLDCHSMEFTPFKIDFNEYSLVLINTNVSHNLSDSAYNQRRAACERVAKSLKKESLKDVTIIELTAKKEELTEDDYIKALYILEENQRVLKASNAIKNNNLQALGKLLYETHEGLSKHYQVSCDELDFLVQLAKEDTNILGARMMGGGFGGCTINLIHKNAINDFIHKVSKSYYSKFKINPSVYQVKIGSGARRIENH